MPVENGHATLIYSTYHKKAERVLSFPQLKLVYVVITLVSLGVYKWLLELLILNNLM